MRVEPRPSASVRCAYCHGSLGPVFNRCPACRTPLHLDCWQRLPGCPILGCGGQLGSAPKPNRSFLARYWWVPVAQLAAALLIGALSVFVGAERGVEPPAQSVPAVALEAEPYMLRHVLASIESPDESLRLGAVISLGKTGGEGAASALANCLERDSSVPVRLHAAKGLSKLSPPRSEHSVVKEALRRSLRRETSTEVRGAVVRAWGFQQRHRGVLELSRVLSRDSSRAVRVAAVVELRHIVLLSSSKEARAALEAATRDRSWEVRQAALRAQDDLRKLGAGE